MINVYDLCGASCAVNESPRSLIGKFLQLTSFGSFAEKLPKGAHRLGGVQLRELVDPISCECCVVNERHVGTDVLCKSY